MGLLLLQHQNRLVYLHHPVETLMNLFPATLHPHHFHDDGHHWTIWRVMLAVWMPTMSLLRPEVFKSALSRMKRKRLTNHQGDQALTEV